MSSNVLGKRVMTPVAPIGFSEQFKNDRPSDYGENLFKQPKKLTPEQTAPNPFIKKPSQDRNPSQISVSSVEDSNIFADLKAGQKPQGKTLEQASNSLL